MRVVDLDTVVAASLGRDVSDYRSVHKSLTLINFATVLPCAGAPTPVLTCGTDRATVAARNLSVVILGATMRTSMPRPACRWSSSLLREEAA
jgi:hypothetical protein